MNPFTRIWLSPRDAYRSANLESGLLRFSLIWARGAAYAFDQSVFDGKREDHRAGIMGTNSDH